MASSSSSSSSPIEQILTRHTWANPPIEKLFNNSENSNLVIASVKTLDPDLYTSDQEDPELLKNKETTDLCPSKSNSNLKRKTDDDSIICLEDDDDHSVVQMKKARLAGSEPTCQGSSKRNPTGVVNIDINSPTKEVTIMNSKTSSPVIMRNGGSGNAIITKAQSQILPKVLKQGEQIPINNNEVTISRVSRSSQKTPILSGKSASFPSTNSNNVRKSFIFTSYTDLIDFCF